MNMNHVHLAAADLEVTTSFYVTHFGFKLTERHGPGYFLRNVHGFLIALDPATSPDTFPTWFHLGFCLPTEQEVHKAHERFLSLGVLPVRKLLAASGEYASFFVQDPDGVRIEVSWHAV